MQGRLEDIDRAKGLAILLVVFGHIVARQPPTDNEWYVFAKTAVYSFHMAFFMFLSGVVYFSRLRAVSNVTEYFAAVSKRFVRLMPAYFIFAGAIFLGKLAAQQFVHVDNPVHGIDDLFNIVLYPMLSVSSFLWYIYVLFVVSAFALAIFTLTRGKLIPLVAIGFGLLLLPNIDFLAIGQITKYFFFFALGGLAITHWSRYSSLVDHIWLPTFLLMLAILATQPFGGKLSVVVAVLSIPALHGLCRKQFIGSRFLLFAGAMTFPIYLMNTIFIGITKAVMLKFATWDGENFFIFFPLMFSAGVIGPILIKKHVFSRVSFLDRITS